MSKKSRTKSKMGTNTCQKPKSRKALAQEPTQCVVMSGTSGKAHQRNKKRAASRRAKKQGLTTDTSNTHNTPDTPATMSSGILPAMNGLRVSDFHWKVTKLSVTEVKKANDAFLRKVDAKDRPSEKEYNSGAFGVNQGNYTYSKPLVQALAATKHQHVETSLNGNLEMFFSEPPLLIDMAVLLAFDGFKSLENMTIANGKSWSQLSSGMAIFNFSTRAFEGTPRGKVFLAITPEYTVEDLIKERVHGTSHELNIEAANLALIGKIYTDCKQQNGASSDLRKKLVALTYSGTYGDELVKSIRSFSELKKEVLDNSHQAEESSKYLPWRMSSVGAMNALSELLKSIFARRNTIEVLHFQKVPVLDRRLVAIILRGCPRVRMIGIYDCRLIHFGDVICLLDLIDEINTSRRADGLPEIEAFDFYPNFNYGTPWNHPSARTHGLTWKPYPNEGVRRGVFRILLEAHFKACRMGLKLLFEETHGFRTFLNRIPTLTRSMPYFLDALYRHMDAAKARNPNTDALDRAFDDMQTLINMGLESQSSLPSPSLPKRNRDRIKKALYFCCSCGYEMGEHFFFIAARSNPPHRRTCAGCHLRRVLDQEDDHGKLARREIIENLFPDWDGGEFNQDAPMHQHGRSLMNLVSDEDVRPAEPGLQVDSNGHIFQPNFEIALVRDRKAHYDSLQDLPDLEQIAIRAKGMMQWIKIEQDAQADDALRTTRKVLSAALHKTEGNSEALPLDQGNAGHVCEPQPTPPQPRSQEFW